MPLLHTGVGVTAAIAALAVAASILTLVASTLLLWRYRTTVARLMSAHASDGDQQIVGGACPSQDTSPSLRDSDGPKTGPIWSSGRNRLADCLYRETKAAPRRHASTHAIAGGLFALLVGTASFFAFSQTQVNYLRAASHPLQFLFMVWTFAWPIVLTTNIVTAASQRNQRLSVFIYFVVLITLGGLISLTATEASIQVGDVSLPAWSGQSPLALANKWSGFNLIPTLLVLIFRRRRLRAVAPLVLSFMTVLSGGLLAAITAGIIYWELSAGAIGFASQSIGLSNFAATTAYFLLLIAAACVVFGVLGWYVLAWIRRGYQRRRLSDQSLAIDAIWLIFAAFYAALLAFAGPGWAISALAAFFIYRITVGIGNRRDGRKVDYPDYGPALLILRVFAIGKRSEILFDAVTRRWRQIGSVNLIAGTDLALSTVAPHQFLTFVSGKLGQLFVHSDAEISRRLALVDQGRDADGRFRINDFFCHADTWQAVLKKLIKNTDAVLMDLRNLTRNNAGCVFEIRELLNAVPLERLIFVMDGTTDKNFLNQTLQETCCELRPDSPNVGLSWSALQPVKFNSVGDHELQGLLQRICEAVGFRHEGIRQPDAA